MLIAIETFVDPSDGSLIEAGRTAVAECADVAHAFPARFTVLTDAIVARLKRGRLPLKRSAVAPMDQITRIGGEARLVAPTRKRQTPAPEIPELRADVTSKRVKIKLGAGALRGICAELDRAWPGLLDVMETGGTVYGMTKIGAIELIEASGPGPDDGKARRLPDAVRIDASEGHAIAEELRRIRHDEMVGVVGGWHTHPERIAEPSPQDRISALQSLDDLHKRRGWRAPSQWVDLILYPDEREGWERPSVAGWLTRRLEWGREPVTERVQVEG
jgi:hypothetical protein